ncbi:MAG: hypothetical protein PUI16_05085 [Clostridia bacterium]|nr:hypothetical protein [Clostridia bacterium]MDY5555781.1 hypothetical protein [Blautia sp.]
MGHTSHDIRILGQDCGSAKHGTIRMASFDANIERRKAGMSVNGGDFISPQA